MHKGEDSLCVPAVDRVRRNTHAKELALAASASLAFLTIEACTVLELRLDIEGIKAHNHRKQYRTAQLPDHLS